MEIQCPQVSVIIPTYNPNHALQRAIESVLQQTFQNIELIVVDDASPDYLANSITSNYPQVQLLCLSQNRGPSGARNAGIQLAKGNLLAFLDHDDEWSPKYLERQIWTLESDKNCVLAFCNIAESDDNKTYCFCDFKPWLGYPKLSPSILLTQDIISTMSIVMIRREAILKAGLLNESLKICHDKELYLRLLHEGNIAHLAETLATRFIHSNNLSRNNQNLLAEEIQNTVEIFFSDSRSIPYRSLMPEARSYAALRRAKVSRWSSRNYLFTLKMLFLAFLYSPGYMLKNLLASSFFRDKNI
jgi:glycosyltransferase involved in cell wall biosynthesis